MSLQQTFTSKEQIPTEFQAHYAERNGKYELQVDGFESITAVFSKNQELIERQSKDKDKLQDLESSVTQVNSLTVELANKNAEISRLSAELTKTQSTQVPTGYVAVQKKDKELIDKLNNAGLKPEDVAANLAEADTLKKENAEFKLIQSVRTFAEIEKVSNVDALTRLIKQDGVTPSVKEVEENGKKVKRGFLAKQSESGEMVETLYSDYKNENWSAFSTALDAGGQPKTKGNGFDPKPHNETQADLMNRERQAQAASGRYVL